MSCQDVGVGHEEPGTDSVMRYGVAILMGYTYQVGGIWSA